MATTPRLTHRPLSAANTGLTNQGKDLQDMIDSLTMGQINGNPNLTMGGTNASASTTPLGTMVGSFAKAAPMVSNIAGKVAGAGGGIGKLLGGLGGLSSLAGPAGMALSVAPAIAKFITGIKQKKQAAKINPIDPGFQANTGIVDNARKLNDYYNNYTMPGKAAITSQLGANMAGGLDVATQAAGSGGDLLDSATKLAFGQNQAITSLGTQEAQMKENMMGQVMNANAQAGNELVRKNEWDENRYQAQLAEKAALNQASAANKFGAGDQLASLGGSMLNYNAKPWSKPSMDPATFKSVYGRLNKKTA